MKKFTKILLIISPILMILSSIKGYATIVLFPAAIILSLIFVALNILVRKLHEGYPHSPAWVYITFWCIIFLFWGIFLLTPAIWDNGAQWVFFMVPLPRSMEASVDPILSWLSSATWLLLPCVIIFFIIVIILYASLARSRKAKNS